MFWMGLLDELTKTIAPRLWESKFSVDARTSEEERLIQQNKRGTIEFAVCCSPLAFESDCRNESMASWDASFDA